MLQHGLACAEGAGHAESSALCHRQERIDTTDLGHQRLIGLKTLFVALDSLFDGLGEDHAQFLLLALVVDNDAHGGADIVAALLLDGLDRPVLALQIERHHDLMLEEALGNTAHSIAGLDMIADLCDGGKLPVTIGNGIQIDASFQEEATLLRQFRQRILQTVKHLGQKAGAKFHAHQLAGELGRISDLDTV